MRVQELGPADEIAVGKMKTYQVDGETLLVFHLEAGFYATQSLCPHTWAPLKLGKILDGCIIQCPLHHARFDIKSGAVRDWANFPPGIQLLNAVRKEKALKTYPVELKAGKLFVHMSR